MQSIESLPPTTPSLPLDIGRVIHGIANGRLLHRSLTLEERETLENLLPQYRNFLEPGPRVEISALLTRLRSHYFIAKMSPSLAKAVADDWADDLGEFPLWVVRKACSFYRRTEQNNPPRPAAIIAYCDEHISDERQEQREIERALGP